MEAFADTIADEEARADFLLQATAEMKSKRTTINIKKWAKDVLPADQADAFVDRVKLLDGSVPVVQKDTRLVNTRLDRTMYEFEGGVKVIGPNGALREFFKKNDDGQWVMNLPLRHVAPTRSR